MKAFLLHHLLSQAARDHPDNIAIVDRERTITYRELDEEANRVGNLLRDLGVGIGDRVALYLDKSLEAVVALYGTLKAGACYVPLDPQAPVDRLGYIADDCGVRCLISSTAKAPNWADLAHAAPSIRTIVVLDGEVADDGPDQVRRIGAAQVAAHDVSAPPLTGTCFDLAYILYTSGSTGRPKGVMLSHLNAMSFVEWAAATFDLGPDDRLSSHAPLHFDLSVFDLFAACSRAAALVLVPPRASLFPGELRRFIAAQEITIWYSVPSILTMLVLRGGLETGELPTLRAMLFAGEVFPTKYLRELMGRLPHVRFANLYGPTETNVCSWYDVPPLPDAQEVAIPIGRAIDGVELLVLDEDLQRVADGDVGELYVRGPTVMQGYWGDSDRSERALLPNPYAPHPTDRIYKTGDLVAELPGGDLQFLGRRDAQIKSRGYRIELGDIEAAFYAHPAVSECAAVAVPDDLISNRIKLIVVVEGTVSETELTQFGATRLPKYMLPDSIEFRGNLPKTSTGKIDRQALAASEDGEQ